MLRTAASCDVAFGHRQFLYRAGMLHSADDRPAAVLERSDLPVGGTYLSRLTYLTRLCPLYGSSWWYNCKFIGTKHTRWYFAGDLHRDYGPAVSGSSWWYKCHCGKQMASEANTFMGERGELSSRMRTYCCGCAKLVALNLAYLEQAESGGTYEFVGVYQTCGGQILECPRLESDRARNDFDYLYFRVGGKVRDSDWHRRVDLIF
jgi:hypothetical protein